jgi:hypothetical protein
MVNQLINYHFLYQKAVSDNKKVSMCLMPPYQHSHLIQDCHGLFHGSLVLQTFGSHFLALMGAKKVPSFQNDGDHGALALCTAMCVYILFILFKS